MLKPNNNAPKIVPVGDSGFILLAVRFLEEREHTFLVSLSLRHDTTNRHYLKQFRVLRRTLDPMGKEITYEDFWDYYKSDIWYQIWVMPIN